MKPQNIIRRRAWAWAIYDWANSAVVTMVIATVFPVFYNSIAQQAIGDQAASAFAFIVALALLISVVAGPVIGTIGDLLGSRKRLLILFTVLGSVAVIAMYTIGDGMWVWASILFVFVQIFLSTAFGLYNALLSHIVPLKDQDRLSSLGYALGYIGGGIQLAISVVLITFWENLGLPDQATATRIALLTSGVWWLIFSLPLFMIVPEPPATPMADGGGNPIRDSFARLGKTFRDIRSYRELFKMLVAFFIYNSGIGTIIQLATTYGQQEIGLEQTVLIGALLLTQFVAFPFALIYAAIPDESSKRRGFYTAHILWTTITLPLMGSVAASNNISVPTTLAVLAINQVIGLAWSWFIGARWLAGFASRLNTKSAIIFGLGVYVVISIWGFFLYTATEFWMLAFLVATVQGGTQALSRSMYSALTPRSKSGEFFGFYGLSDKSAGILGPLVFGVVGLSGNLRPAILSVIVFFLLGAFLLSRVKEAEGQQMALAEDEAIGYHDDLTVESTGAA